MSNRPSRLWIAAVPVAVGLMFGSASYRVQDFWYLSGEHRETVAAAPGKWAAATWEYEDAHGETTRTFSVRFAGFGDTSQDYTTNLGDDLTLPEGLVAHQVKLDFKADPSQALRYCSLTLIDDRGREYSIGLNKTTISEPDPCVPLDWPGPSVPIFKTERRGVVPFDGEPRPETWTVTPSFAAPKDAKFVELRVSYEAPDYVTLRLPQ